MFQVPLPIEDTPKDARIKARCIERMTILEPSLPNREQVCLYASPYIPCIPLMGMVAPKRWGAHTLDGP